VDEFTIAVSPDGHPIHRADDLPELPLPRKIVIGDEVLSLDGWNLRIWPVWRDTLDWLTRQAGRWCKEDPSPATKIQVSGLLNAIETTIKRKPEYHGSKQGEFEF